MPTKTPGKRTARMTSLSSTRSDERRSKSASVRQRWSPAARDSSAHILFVSLSKTGAKDIRVMATSIPDWLVDLGVETFEGSITNSEDTKRAVEGIRDIYHLAGKVSREREDSREMYDIHVEGTRLLCDAAKAAGAKNIVLASTSGTIAVTKDGDLIPDETYPPPLEIISRWPYYASKAYQEMAALGTIQWQRPATGHHESESAAWSRRRSTEFNQGRSRLHGEKDWCRADGWREFC